MQKLAEICIRRPVFASMIVMALVVVGVAGYANLGVDRFPSVDLPTVRIMTRLAGASPEEMESLVSQPIEEVVNTIEGIRELRSVSGNGSSFVIVTFELNRDIDVAAQDVRDRVATVLRRSARRHGPAHDRQDRRGPGAGHDLGGVRAALDPRVDRDCGQDRQDPDRAVVGRRAR